MCSCATWFEISRARQARITGGPTAENLRASVELRPESVTRTSKSVREAKRQKLETPNLVCSPTKIRRRLRAILFAALAWGVVWLMRAETWPSRSQLIALAASIATAWVVIEFGVRVLANPFLRRIVRWGAWVWATLYFLGLLAPARAVLDSIALDVGNYRLSLLTVLRAVVVAGLLLALTRLASRLISGSLARNAE